MRTNKGFREQSKGTGIFRKTLCTPENVIRRFLISYSAAILIDKINVRPKGQQ